MRPVPSATASPRAPVTPTPASALLQPRPNAAPPAKAPARIAPERVVRAPAPPTAVRPPPIVTIPEPRVDAHRATARTAERPLTGGDLARWRAARGITQRDAAAELGVAPSTVAKAELVPSKQLGEHLQSAMWLALGR